MVFQYLSGITAISSFSTMYGVLNTSEIDDYPVYTEKRNRYLKKGILSN